MRAVESEMLAKGFKKSNNPDLLVSIFTKSREKINVNDNRFGGLIGILGIMVLIRLELPKKQKELYLLIL